MTRKKKPVNAKLYTLEVSLIEGPVSAKFTKRNPVISRTIEIRGDQSLDDLHDIIFEAFDRSDPHLYEFQLKGSGPKDPKADRYLPSEMDDFGEDMLSTEASIDSLDLEINESFGYWFDFGDDWRHQIDVLSISEQAPKGFYPRIVKRVGESPPQYEYME